MKMWKYKIREKRPVNVDCGVLGGSLGVLGGTINSNSTYDKDISEIMNKTKIEDNDIDKFIDIMEKIEIRKKCDEIAEEYLIKIQDTISKIPTSNKYKKTFNEITNFLMYREV